MSSVTAGRGVRDFTAVQERRTAKPAPSASEWPAALDLEQLAEREPQPPQFIIDDWAPVGYAWLLAGHGGVGKSGIALQLAVCMAAGVPFCGLEVARRRVLYLDCEDRENIMHWRLDRACRHLGLELAALRGWLDVVDLVGHDTILWERDARGVPSFTPAYAKLAERVRSSEAEVLVVDGISDTFGGNENAPGDVKRFVNALVSLMPADRGAVLLVGHIAKPTAAGISSEGYRGSTAWHNSVRARWYLYPETQQAEEGGRTERTGELLLELQKSNLGRVDRSIRFRWDADAHLFVGEAVGASAFDRKHQDREEQAGIRRALQSCTAAGDTVPAATMGHRTAFHVLKCRTEFPASLASGKGATRRFWRHIEELRAMKHVSETAIPRKSDRHKVRCLVLTEDGMRACGQS